MRNAISNCCSVPKCPYPVSVKKDQLCYNHWQRKKRTGDVQAHKPIRKSKRAPKNFICSMPKCESPKVALGYCGKHYWRLKAHDDPTYSNYEEWGSGWVDSKHGYRVLYRPDHPNSNKSGCIPEHRYIMSEVLGRPLTEFESVHHKNGNRVDNRPENLQLRVRYHGSGQDVEDLVSYSLKILETYAPGHLQVKCRKDSDA